MMNKEKK